MKMRYPKYPRKKSLLYANQLDEYQKKVSFRIPESSLIQMKTDMLMDGMIRVDDFLCELIRLYLEKDEDFLKCLSKIKQIITRHGCKRRDLVTKELSKGREMLNKFKILDENEKNDLFDILENELPQEDDI